MSDSEPPFYGIDHPSSVGKSLRDTIPIPIYDQFDLGLAALREENLRIRSQLEVWDLYLDEVEQDGS